MFRGGGDAGEERRRWRWGEEDVVRVSDFDRRSDSRRAEGRELRGERGSGRVAGKHLGLLLEDFLHQEIVQLGSSSV